jgi:hypothetical protein
VTIQPANLKSAFPMRLPKPGPETAVALAGTAFAAVLVVLTAMYAGPLWRDETNTINVAQMPSLKELWASMSSESFPPLWPLVLRGCGFLGLADSDASIRVLGLYVGLFFLASLWLCSRWMGSRAPILSVALLGALPSFVFIVGANRAYGLAAGLLVLSFGLIWRMVEVPSKARIFWAGLVCILFAHCVYYDAVFLCSMLAGAALVTVRRRQWKTLGALVGVGLVAGAPLAIYLPIIHRGSPYVAMNQEQIFGFPMLWYKLSSALTARSSAHLPRFDGPEIWLWVVLLSGASVVALVMQLASRRQAQKPEATAAITARRADLALFCVVSLLFGSVGYMAFLLKLQYVTQAWYYVEMLCLCAIALDGILSASQPALRPWGLLRIGFMVVMMAWGAGAAWEEAHTRRSNIDLIAAVLGQKATEKDLIVVQGAWEGITFDRYYHGKASWVTVPPIDSHKMHRNDLAMEKMNQPDPMAPVLHEITDTLQGSNNVWLVGNMIVVHPKPSPDLPVKRWGEYMNYWSGQVTAHLMGHALYGSAIEIPVSGPVNHLENLPVLRFSGYKSNAE